MIEPARVACFPSKSSGRFPRWIFNPLNSASLHYRSASLLQYLLCSRTRWELSQSCDFDARYIYSTLVSKNDNILALVSLWSFARRATRLPRVAIALDDDFSEYEAKLLFSKINLPYVDFYNRADVSSWLLGCGYRCLAAFCSQHVFGYKLGFNLLLSSGNRVLYSDTDVLWFKDIAQDSALTMDVKCVASSFDVATEPYDAVLMDWLSKKYSFDGRVSPQGCAGVALFAQSKKLAEEVESLLEECSAKVPISRLTEQTIVSFFSKLEQSFLPIEFMNMDERTTSWHPSRLIRLSCGRHYPAGMRSQFWIDAFYLRYFYG